MFDGPFAICDLLFAIQNEPKASSGLQRYAQLHPEHDLVRSVVVAAGIDNPLKIRLNGCPVEDVERVENFLYPLVVLYIEAGTRMGVNECPLGVPDTAGNAVPTRCYTARIVGSLRPRAPVVESCGYLALLK